MAHFRSANGLQCGGNGDGDGDDYDDDDRSVVPSRRVMSGVCPAGFEHATYIYIYIYIPTRSSVCCVVKTNSIWLLLAVFRCQWRVLRKDRRQDRPSRARLRDCLRGCGSVGLLLCTSSGSSPVGRSLLTEIDTKRRHKCRRKPLSVAGSANLDGSAESIVFRAQFRSAPLTRAVCLN